MTTVGTCTAENYCCYYYCYYYYYYYYTTTIATNAITREERTVFSCVPMYCGGTHVQRGAAPSVRITRKKGSFFKTSTCPRFCKRRVLFCTKVRSMGVKIPLQSTKYTRLRRRVSPKVTGHPSLLPPLAAAKHAEDLYKIIS